MRDEGFRSVVSCAFCVGRRRCARHHEDVGSGVVWSPDADGGSSSVLPRARARAGGPSRIGAAVTVPAVARRGWRAPAHTAPRAPLLVRSPRGRRLWVHPLHGNATANPQCRRSAAPFQNLAAEASAVFFCKLKGVAHAPAFCVHSTELERVAERRGRVTGLPARGCFKTFRPRHARCGNGSGCRPVLRSELAPVSLVCRLTRERLNPCFSGMRSPLWVRQAGPERIPRRVNADDLGGRSRLAARALPFP